MEKLIGVIHLDGEMDFLKELTYFRCGAAVPFGSRYRMIDFVLSNMVNSQIQDIAVFARQKYRSLMDHLGTGKPWDLDRKRGGLFILPPDWNDPTDFSRGDLQHFHNNRDFFTRGLGEYVLVTGSHHICNIDYRKVFQKHLDSGADVTAIYQSVSELEPEHCTEKKLELDEDGNVINITTDATNHHLFMDMYILKKSLLLELVDYCIARKKDNLLLDGIIANLDRLTVASYHYTGYLAVINSVESYYKHSMSLLNVDVYTQLFLNRKPIYTKSKDEPPTKYAKGATTKRSLLANGCVIEGTVENSILFRGVHVHKDAVVRNSIIMQRCEIQKGTLLENVILDKDIIISPDRTFIGAAENPYIIAKRKVL
ncbi:glucose-1-phosphate adenylyltransferase subunit GlgD [Alkalihalobacillus sp. MEB130]|uniref:glucose-1-phosphate adenylyltransferase subunit GlgD n=1 Tax=Alkalihalobacillus sp. MEB130 TaxID=2976704 RepID=UPI0028DEE1B7|nr:glucose-1-phosphate adenylyltransferase subunit GlgD [Alkalihalobacillus sp. MEB130]MDT8862068.1 glucose-1-phosphate adenylyltransferase subunit GlgD [Alkalihalobacillus sp. MEB130]